MMHNGSGPVSRPDSLLIPNSTQHQQQFYAPHPPSTGTSSMVTSTASLLNTPTAGTPLLLTPNTLKSIEHSILQTLGEDTEEGFLMESQQYSGNFVPPLPSSTSTITLINTWQGGQVSSDCLQHNKDDGGAGEQNVCPVKSDHMNDDDDDDDDDEQERRQVENKVAEKKKPVRKSAPRRAPPVRKGSAAVSGKSGPRRQASSDKPPKTREEDERRKVRRERNKLAAARCRKRRVDHTRKLEEETDGLEAKKRALQNQITDLHSQKEELEFLLEAHNCVKKVIKNEVLADLQNLPNNKDQAIKLKRPSSLSVIPVSSGGAPPIPISTPSNGIAGLGFEPLEWAVNTPGADDESSGRGGHAGHHHGIPSSDILTKVHSPLVTPVLPFKRLQDL